MSASTSRTCLFTAATESFTPGVFVMLGTFLKHHPGFDGDIVIAHDGLPEAHRDVLSAASDRVRFEPVSFELRARLARLGAADPALRAKLPTFFLLEAFRLSGYRKVLCCDADALFRASVAELFDADEMLICCRDVVSLQGLVRDAATFAPMPSPQEGAHHTPRPEVLDGTFNSGFLVIDGRLTGEGVYADLLSMVRPEAWRGMETVHFDDQFLLNRYFAGRRTLVGSTYNYIPIFSAHIRKREGLDMEEAKVLHFVGPVKPWTTEAMLRWTLGDFSRKPQSAFDLWYAAYVDCLTATHPRRSSAAPSTADAALRKRPSAPPS